MSTADQPKSELIEVNYPCAVRRFILRWDKNEWKIVNQVRVSSMTLPAPDPLPAGEQSRGFWIEAADGKGAVYHREVMPDPLLGMEQFEEKGQINRINHPAHQVSLEVLVPDLPEVSELHLVSNPLGIHEHGEPSRLKRTVLKLPSENGGSIPDHPNEEHHH